MARGDFNIKKVHFFSLWMNANIGKDKKKTKQNKKKNKKWYEVNIQDR